MLANARRRRPLANSKGGIGKGLGNASKTPGAETSNALQNKPNGSGTKT
jgi:hypothetical protein